MFKLLTIALLLMSSAAQAQTKEELDLLSAIQKASTAIEQASENFVNDCRAVGVPVKVCKCLLGEGEGNNPNAGIPVGFFIDEDLWGKETGRWWFTYTKSMMIPKAELMKAPGLTKIQKGMIERVYATRNRCVAK